MLTFVATMAGGAVSILEEDQIRYSCVLTTPAPLAEWR